MLKNLEKWRVACYLGTEHPELAGLLWQPGLVSPGSTVPSAPFFRAGVDETSAKSFFFNSGSEEIRLGVQHIRLAPNLAEPHRYPEEPVLRFLEIEDLEEATTFRWNRVGAVVDLHPLAFYCSIGADPFICRIVFAE